MPKVPSPRPDYEGNLEALDHRSKLVLAYGEDTVRAAEISSVIGIFMTLGIVKPGEFIEVVEGQCKRVDERRRRAAGFD